MCGVTCGDRKIGYYILTLKVHQTLQKIKIVAQIAECISAITLTYIPQTVSNLLSQIFAVVLFVIRIPNMIFNRNSSWINLTISFCFIFSCVFRLDSPASRLKFYNLILPFSIETRYSIIFHDIFATRMISNSSNRLFFAYNTSEGKRCKASVRMFSIQIAADGLCYKSVGI